MVELPVRNKDADAGLAQTALAIQFRSISCPHLCTKIDEYVVIWIKTDLFGDTRQLSEYSDQGCTYYSIPLMFLWHPVILTAEKLCHISN